MTKLEGKKEFNIYEGDYRICLKINPDGDPKVQHITTKEEFENLLNEVLDYNKKLSPNEKHKELVLIKQCN